MIALPLYRAMSKNAVFILQIMHESRPGPRRQGDKPSLSEAIRLAGGAGRRALSGHCIASRETGEGAGVCMELEGRSFCANQRSLSPWFSGIRRQKNPDAKPRRGKSITIGFCRSE